MLCPNFMINNTVENWADNERGVLDTKPMVTKLQHGGRPLLTAIASIL